MNYSGGGFGWMMPFRFGFFGLIVILAWWVFIIWAIIAFARWVGQLAGGHPQRHVMSALGIAKERYAKGELNKEEYEEIKKELMR